MLFGVALLEKEFESGLSKEDVLSLIDVLDGDEFYPIEIFAKEHECSAMGFITSSAANSIDFDYESSGLNAFIANILDDMNNESPNGMYQFKELTISLSR